MIKTNTNSVVGQIIPFGGGVLPFGFLSCDGTVVAQSLYPKLWAVIGPTWNVGGEAVGFFRLPDFRGRTLLGDGTGAGLSARSLGQSGIGAETHVLSAGQIPTHTHNVGSLSVSAHTVNDPGHVHAILGLNDGINDGFPTLTGGSQGWTEDTQSAATGISVNNHSMSGSTENGSSSGLAGQSHNNMQPSVVVKYIISYI